MVFVLGLGSMVLWWLEFVFLKCFPNVFLNSSGLVPLHQCYGLCNISGGGTGDLGMRGGGDQILEFKVHLSKYIHCTRHSGKLILCATEPVVGGEMSKGDLS